MRFTSNKIPDVKLVFFERTDMPESSMQEVDGKKQFVKTGKTVEMTTYTFRTSDGEKLVLMSKNNSYRNLEGELVDIDIEVKYNEFDRRSRVSLVAVIPVSQRLA